LVEMYITKKEIRERLIAEQDIEYRDFQIKLTPGIDAESVIGVRTPVVKKLAKEIFKEGKYDEFLKEIPHFYYDEMNIHSFILCEIKDYDTVICEIDKFLPYVNNWATCDSMKPKKAFQKNLDRLETDIKRWIKSGETYTIRFGIEMLMNFYLDEHFKPEYLEWVSKIRSEEYYVNMMIAWYFATALAKQYDATIPFIEKHLLDDWTHRKSIQKARESYRITNEQKEYLNSLKRTKALG